MSGIDALRYTYLNGATSITSATQSSASSVTVAPYSLTVVRIPGSGGTGSTAPSAFFVNGVICADN